MRGIVIQVVADSAHQTVKHLRNLLGSSTQIPTFLCGDRVAVDRSLELILQLARGSRSDVEESKELALTVPRSSFGNVRARRQR
jgi:hypothetical protein